MARPGVALLVLVAIGGGCAAWRTRRAIEPITYTLPPDRQGANVGNLRRLAVLPVQVRLVSALGFVTHAHIVDAGLVYQGLCGFLHGVKGYEVVRIADAAGRWRPELAVGDLGVSIEGLRAEWEAADTGVARQAVVRQLGRALHVDGIVTSSIERNAREGPAFEVEAFAAVMVTMALLDIPLFYTLGRSVGEIAVHETASGLPVWRQRIPGIESLRWRLTSEYPLYGWCRDLDHAIPADLFKPGEGPR
jgi:hypothetical protein